MSPVTWITRTLKSRNTQRKAVTAAMHSRVNTSRNRRAPLLMGLRVRCWAPWRGAAFESFPGAGAGAPEREAARRGREEGREPRRLLLRREETEMGGSSWEES